MRKFDLSNITSAIFFMLLVNAAALAQDVPKFEVGVQFSVLSLNRPSVLVTGRIDPGFIGFGPGVGSRTEPGLGARFTYNLTKSIAFEAETNLFPRREDTVAMPGGRIFQGQFGVKAGKRFQRFGIFGKARPGFVGFTQVTKLVETFTVPADPFGRVFTLGKFAVGKDVYFSTDLGGVVEFYPSRRILTRIDLGDTIIHYGTFRGIGAFLSHAIVERPPETRHNLQFSAGVGFRF